jgi:ParB/RepB/Spo0J family partition protein
MKPVVIKANKMGVTFAPINGIQVQEGFNVRKNATPEAELVKSIKEAGVINPIHVRYKDRAKSSLLVIDGHRRLNAAKEAGLGSMPIINHGFPTDADAVIVSLTASEGQKKLTKKEKLEGYRRLNDLGLDKDEIALVMVVDVRTVSEALRVEKKGTTELKKAASKGPKGGGVSPRAAARVAALPKEKQNKLIKEMAGKPLDEQLEIVRAAEKKTGVKKPGRKAAPKTEPAKQEVKTKRGGYRVADDILVRMQKLEEVLSKKLTHSPSHRVHTGQQLIIKCLKGAITVDEVFGFDKVK